MNMKFSNVSSWYSVFKIFAKLCVYGWPKQREKDATKRNNIVGIPFRAFCFSR